ncbi:hypothetical protein LXL04_023053 [Taraxacum kok-saghyz]
MFRKQALDWWNIIRDNLGSETAMKMPWSDFKDKVIGKYCNERSRDRMEDEFRSLQKGSQTIAQYPKQFMEKLGFLKHIAPDEENKIKFYLKGLPSDMKAFVRNAHVSTLEKAIEESQLLEDELTPIKDEKFTGDKRRWEAPNRNVKRFHPNSGARKFESKREFGICPRCNKRHTRNCYCNSVVCNKCGKL